MCEKVGESEKKENERECVRGRERERGKVCEETAHIALARRQHTRVARSQQIKKAKFGHKQF
jgi:hypothetical protein